MKKLFTLLSVFLLSTGIFAQEHNIGYQVIVWDACTQSTYTITGDTIQTGQSFTIPAYTLPSSLSAWQRLYNALVGVTFSIDSGATNKDIYLGINILGFDCNNEGFYFNPDLFFFMGVTVVDEDGNFFGFDDVFPFNPGKYARLTFPLSDDFTSLLDTLMITLDDIGFGYYVNNVFIPDGLEFEVTDDYIQLRLSHFSKFGGGRGSVVDVENPVGDKPRDFALYQNYPNPFNPTTKIRYELPNSGFVTLKVYDALGSEVKTLVKGNKPAGSHEVEFNAENLPSGIYFYELKTNNQVLTRKMILLK